MGDVSVDWEGKAECIAAITAWADREKIATYRATSKAGDDVQGLARGNFLGQHPPGFPHDGAERPNVATGTLQMSIVPTGPLAEGPGEFTVLVGPTVIYGRIIELGGTITPKEHEYLSWFSPWLGRRVYRKEVTLRGWPYLKPAYEEFVPQMNDLYERHWTDAIFA